MATLTDSVNSKRGLCVLYVPRYIVQDPSKSIEDKDLVHQIESIVIRWTKQIQKMIYESKSAIFESKQRMHDSFSGLDGFETKNGLLDEIEFWKSRNENLGRLRDQLESSQIQSILSFLEMAKSVYLSPFLNLKDDIRREAASAEENLKFLLCLEDPCQKLTKARPETIPELLPTILHSIRFIWNHSHFYNTDEHICGLLAKVSNQVIDQCQSHISSFSLFSGNSSAKGLLFTKCIQNAWKMSFSL